MGIYRPEGVRIGDRVWLDNDRDGVQDGNEVGVSGVTVTLVDNNGTPVTQDRDGNPITPLVTDANGNYLFDNLPNGDYAVSTTPSTGLLADGDENLSLDMGIYPLSEVQVGDTVWYDNDADGIQDLGEQGVAGVVVSLFNANGTSVTDMAGNSVGPTATDANGNYLFENLPAGDYYVTFDSNSLPANHLPTIANAGNDDSLDSDAILHPSSMAHKMGLTSQGLRA